MSTSVLLDIERIANDLGVSQVEAKRLISSKRLPATRIGEDGPWRVTVEDFEKFVKAGAAGVRLAEFNELHPDWFGNDYAYQAGTFPGAVIEAAQEQVPSDEQLRRDFEAQPGEQSLDYKIEAKGAVAEVLRRAVPNAMFGNTPTGEAETRFSNWGELYAVETLRNVARQIIRNRDLSAAGFDALYDSPASYQEIVNEAYDAASKRRIVFSKVFSFNGGPFGVLPVDRRASFLFELSAILTPSSKARLIALAF